MNYELAKRLKDTGFPQEFKLGSWCCESHGDDAYEKKCQCYGDLLVYAPTLSELIEACGEKFKQLNYHKMKRKSGYGLCHTPDEGIVDMNVVGQWTARARLGKEHENHKKRWGHTPEEAVANLWLALNRKE